MRWPAINHTRLLRYTGLFTYLCTGIPLLRVDWTLERVSGLSHPDVGLVLLLLCYVLFGIVYWLLTWRLGSRRHPALKILGLGVLTATAIGVGWFSHSGLSALLLVVVAVVLPWTLPLPIGIAWLVLQNLALIPVFVGFPGFGWGTATLQAALYLGFATLMFVTSMVARQQDDAREEQRRLNSELRATRALLAESSRIGERMRIARELHDLLGHHLTALTLNLEVASHRVAAAEVGPVRQAQAIAKQLLGDVREVVSELRQGEALDLSQALRSLIEGVPTLKVHLDLPPAFSVDEPQRAQVLLRTVQEILTNTARHAGARNLWLSFSRTEAGELKLDARDDGRGAGTIRPGNGLNGMRERLAAAGGRLLISAEPGRGFALSAWLPMEKTL
ncbi:sensor histidine kinase [Metallibacterium sp.]|uniref:sensor histidine kinase n=1 Tax=Metallibacterium sp. TaxID=2940281 RepID=UPI00261753FF|nr:sensor histidine kinase [Metallibacterium sp.]